jgi:ribose 5-phosphate isomerase A
MVCSGTGEGELSEALKTAVGQEIAKKIKNNMVIGIGTGSTVDAAVLEIGRRVQAEQLTIHAVTSSLESARLAEENGITVLHSAYAGTIAFGFDGADALNTDLQAIKGKGGAMLREKILAERCDYFVLIADESKLVSDIATACSVPVEVIPEALDLVQRRLQTLGVVRVQLRKAVAKHGAVITESGNCILDVSFKAVTADLEKTVKSITGVVESGLFLTQAHEALIARQTGIESIVKKR